MPDSKKIIRFLLDGAVVSLIIDGTMYHPTTTLLQYLRSIRGHKGVKEGCSEGDCGACTVVIASPENGKLLYKAVDSCLVLLPMIHGKQVITVENLALHKGNEMKLHPVQQAVVDAYASQCGYCTPGIVMSMFALYKSSHKPDADDISDALTGNLCRCTGYFPILQAAEKVCSKRQKDHFSENEAEICRLLQDIRKKQSVISIKTLQQQYHKVFNLKDALRIKSLHPDALIIAGSTDVSLRVTKKNEILPHILDISDVDELKFFKLSTKNIVIGSCISLEDLRKKVRVHLPAMHDILNLFGSRQIRNMATAGGNIGAASPIGDTLPLLFVLNAEVEIRSSRKTKMVNIHDFITSYRTTCLKAKEVITAIHIPLPEKNSFVKAYKISKRRDLDISTCSAAFRLVPDKKTGRIKNIFIAYGGMAATTSRATVCENFLNGKLPDRKNIHLAAEILHDTYTPLSDARSGEEFRKTAASNLLLRFFEDIKMQSDEE